MTFLTLRSWGMSCLCVWVESGVERRSLLACWWMPEQTLSSWTELQLQHDVPCLILIWRIRLKRKRRFSWWSFLALED